ncbi:AraC family transcriptional regulator [Listeria seeligeri]|uniref:AraC family transcriptional regulator n=1 Tax=Listeria seeligeri TaxID=1640 RepID=UPI0010DA0485|nr:helix-turn-helix domain-containing protein [Listeria seeligeri]MBC2225352.1 AraC family transcriptional regulator [Listeria seeligeri]
MHAWESIQAVVDFIEDNLTEELTMEDLAKVAALSPYYFQRLFRRLVKVPVREYTRMRRLASACEQLQETDRTVLDIAEEYHFSGHANFTRAFKKAFGVTPEEMRHIRTITNQYVKPNLLLNYEMADENVPLITDGIVLEVRPTKLEQPKPIIGIAMEIPINDIMGGLDSGISITGKMWDDFHREKASIVGLSPDGKECGVVYTGGAPEGYCTYLAGAEADSNQASEGYTVFTMPAQDYILYSVEAETFNDLVTSAVYKAQTFMEKWMKKHSLRPGGFAVEMYLQDEEGATAMETWLDTIPTQPSEES